MKRSKHSYRFVICLVAVAVNVHAQDWPQWRGPNRDAKVVGFRAPTTWPKELMEKWKVSVGDGVATPALVGDKIFVFTRQDDREITRCLDAATGKQIWQDKYEAQGATGPASGFAGPRSSPTVSDGKVVTYGVQGTLSCLDAGTGKVIWRKDDYSDSLPRFFTSSSPLVVDGLCVAQLGGERAGAIVAYELATGNEKWKWTGDGTAYASPVLLSMEGTSVVIAETAENILALGLADGELLWETSYAVTGRGYNAATPLIDGQTIIYTGSNRGAKAVRLEKQGNGLTEKELWTNQDNSVQYNTPVLKDGLLFGLSSRDILFCINAESGQTAWTEPLGEVRGDQRPNAGRAAANRPNPGRAQEGNQRGRREGGRRGRGGRGRGGSRPGYGSIVDAGSVLLALTPAANLVVFEPNGEEFKRLASYKVAEGGTYAYPIAAGNRLFIKDQDSVTLWTIE